MAEAAAALALKALRVRRGERLVVDGVELEASAGRIVSVIGPNGAGKSSLLKAVAGILPYEGEITIQGASAREMGRADRARRVAYVPERSELRSALSVREVVSQGRYAHNLGRVRPAENDRAEIERALVLTDARSLADRSFTTLSLGEKQRVLIARALATGARVLLLDEPTSALDVGHALRLYTLLRTLAADGYCIVAVLHPLAEALTWTDDALLLDRGRCLVFGAVRDVIRAGEIERVYGVRLVPESALGFRLARDTPPAGSP